MTGADRRVAIVGGGLAGLAAAVALAERGVGVTLFEARRRLGGRASSFEDARSGEKVDHCQHVSLGCCTNLADFARRLGIRDLFRQVRQFSFADTKGKVSTFSGSARLPAPLHLVGGLLALKFISRRDRLSIGRAIVKLARTRTNGADDGLTIGQWLRQQNQSQQAIDQFWSAVLVSALGEATERVGIHYARKVFVDTFLSNRDGYVMEVPRAPLDELYGTRLERWLASHGVQLHLSSPITAIDVANGQVRAIRLRDRSLQQLDAVVLAVPWRRASELLAALPACATIAANLKQLTPAPISAVHLWFDRAITDLSECVLVGPQSKWLFHRRWVNCMGEGDNRFYYQVVISASHDLAGKTAEQVIDEVVQELGHVFAKARAAQLLHGRLITDSEAVFSPVPGVDRWRPMQETPLAGLYLAGDWTATGWPATMEGAIRSGYLAAEAILKKRGTHESIVVPDLKRSWIASRLFA